MDKLKAVLRALCALSALPLAWTLAGCAFEPSGKPRLGTDGLRCDIVETRRCASAGDVMVGIDVSRPYEDGFWPGRSSKIGLDRSPEAIAQCGPQGQAIVFRCPFPDGCAVCVTCGDIGSPGSEYAEPGAACVDHCQSQDWGNAAQCAERARASNGSPATCFPDACSMGPNWIDPRRATPTPTITPSPTPLPPAPVVWRDRINTTVQGNVLRKMGGMDGIWDAGASSTALLTSGTGYVDFGVGETNTYRMCGLSIGGHPDTNPDYAGIDFAVYLHNDGTFSIMESGSYVPLTHVIGPLSYAPGDRFRVAVVMINGQPRVRYSRNGEDIHTSTREMLSYPFRVDASLRDANATITDAVTKF